MLKGWRGWDLLRRPGPLLFRPSQGMAHPPSAQLSSPGYGARDIHAASLTSGHSPWPAPKSKCHSSSCRTGFTTSPAPLPTPPAATSTHNTLQPLTSPCADGPCRLPPACLPLPGMTLLCLSPVPFKACSNARHCRACPTAHPGPPLLRAGMLCSHLSPPQAWEPSSCPTGSLQAKVSP